MKFMQMASSANPETPKAQNRKTKTKVKGRGKKLNQTMKLKNEQNGSRTRKART